VLKRVWGGEARRGARSEERGVRSEATSRRLLVIRVGSAFFAQDFLRSSLSLLTSVDCNETHWGGPLVVLLMELLVEERHVH